jgi:hypothetical protein
LSQLKPKFAPGLIPFTAVNTPNGVAGLDAQGKVLASAIPAVVGAGFARKGNFDASTGAYPTNPTDGDFYVVSVSGAVGGQTLTVGDSIYYTAATASWNVIDQSRSTDELPEGTTRLYFTNARAQAAAVINSLAASTTQAPTTSAVNTALALKANTVTRFKERFQLTPAQITAQAVVFSNLALANSVHAGVQGLGMIEESTSGDYTLSVDGGTGFTKLTFKNDLATGGATPLSQGDVIFVEYVF